MLDGAYRTGISEAFIWVMGFTVTMGVYRTPASDESSVQVQITGKAYRTFEILIHELFHVAAKEGMFGHKDLDAAAESLDKTLRFKGYEPREQDAQLFDKYVRTHCTSQAPTGTGR